MNRDVEQVLSEIKILIEKVQTTQKSDMSVFRRIGLNFARDMLLKQFDVLVLKGWRFKPVDTEPLERETTCKERHGRSTGMKG